MRANLLAGGVVGGVREVPVRFISLPRDKAGGREGEVGGEARGKARLESATSPLQIKEMRRVAKLDSATEVVMKRVRAFE